MEEKAAEKVGAPLARVAWTHARAPLIRNVDARALAAVCLMSLGEVRILDRLLFVDSAELGFVLESIRGVLAGTPVSKSWQHRLLAPHLVRAMERVRPDSLPVAALRTFTEVFAFFANVLLFVLLRKQGLRSWFAFFACAAFGFARCLLTYRLEYPWDEVDVILFLLFGCAAFSGWSLPRFLPLLLVGAFNHETVLLLPFWLLLSPVERRFTRAARLDVLAGGFAFALLGAAIVLARNLFYVGRPVLENQVLEVPTPVIENHVHVLHNLERLFVSDWVDGRSFISAAFFTTVISLGVCIARGKLVRVSWWTLGFLATVVVFGYVNETRHYLPLLAFWFTYGGSMTSAARH